MAVKTPIVMSAFGTTTRAMATYSHIHKKITAHFPEHRILWSYSSRMVKDKLKNKSSGDIKHPHQVLDMLHQEEHSWAVVQSLHLMCAHEFYRLIQESEGCRIRHTIGLPLLSSPEDYMDTCKAFESYIPENKNHALLLVGHGTVHTGWSTYPALTQIIQEMYGDRVYIGVVEEYPGVELITEKLVRAGIEKVTLAPFMLVAGVHFFEDLISDDEDSWKCILESNNIEVSALDHGIGYNDAIIDIYIRHIEEALDAIPE